MGDLVAVSAELAPVMRPLEPILEQLLPPALPPERLLQTLYVSCANNPGLMKANRQSLVQAASSAAVLALEIDGVTGQGYLVPFKGSAQFVSGYKGMVTIAGRARRTLEGFVVREGEAFEFDEANGLVAHRRTLGGELERRIIGAYAVSRAEGLPTLVRVLSIDQLIAVRDASAGWRAKGQRSTWGTNFDAMCRKTPMRRIANDTPVLGLQQAAALEASHDLGRRAWLHHDGGIVIDGAELDPADVVREAREREEVRAAQPSAGAVLDGEAFEVGQWSVLFPAEGGGSTAVDGKDPERYEALVRRAVEKAGDHLGAFVTLNRPQAEALMDTHGELAGRLLDLYASLET